jgi:hypothetical protein
MTLISPSGKEKVKSCTRPSLAIARKALSFPAASPEKAPPITILFIHWLIVIQSRVEM